MIRFLENDIWFVYVLSGIEIVLCPVPNYPYHLQTNLDFFVGDGVPCPVTPFYKQF